MVQSASSPAAPTSPGLYATFTVTAAVVAAAAAGSSVVLGIPPWAMFVGWVAYFTRRPSPVEGAQTWACVVIGIGLGAACALAVGALAPTLGAFALPAVVLVNATVVIAARGLPVMNNLLGYFLGLITFFAAHQPPGLQTVAILAGAVALGSVAAWVALTVEATLRRVIAR